MPEIYMSRMSRLAGLINKRLLQLSESGHVKEIIKQVLEREKSIPLNNEDNQEARDASQKPLNLTAYTLLFIANTVGILVAFSVFLLEYIFRSSKWEPGVCCVFQQEAKIHSLQ